MNTQKTIYIAGPMTGIPEHNFPAFNEAAARLREEGWFVVNPAENFGGRTDLPRHEYMRLDIKMLADCEAIYLLPGWERSRGAMMEYKVALELELDVYGWARATPAEPLDGFCAYPDSGREILINPALHGLARLEAIIHEARHAQGQLASERRVTRDAHELASLLWRMGYRAE